MGHWCPGWIQMRWACMHSIINKQTSNALQIPSTVKAQGQHPGFSTCSSGQFPGAAPCPPPSLPLQTQVPGAAPLVPHLLQLEVVVGGVGEVEVQRLVDKREHRHVAVVGRALRRGMDRVVCVAGKVSVIKSGRGRKSERDKKKRGSKA